ncbi:MAG: PIN domain-containing protein [Candidatus Korobacteraceae bacterium]
MALDRLVSFLRRHRRVALDTSVFIYQLEANARYVSLSDHIFAWVEQAGHGAVTSTITMTELLVHPYHDPDRERVDSVYGTFSQYPNLNWIAPDLEIADLAALLRARYRLKTADALQAATAVSANVPALVTNDRIFRRVEMLETLVLDELL